MVKPDPITLETEHGRVFQFELGRNERYLVEGHTQQEVDELKEQSQEIPEDFYATKWVRYRFKQPENASIDPAGQTHGTGFGEETKSKADDSKSKT